MCLVTVTCLTFDRIEANAVAGLDTRAPAYCVMNAKNGDVICEKDMMGTFYPASITKILTALVVYENISPNQLNDRITFSHDAVETYAPKESSTLTPKAQEGEVMTVNDALHGMMLPSGNECANALAEYVAGDIPSFVAKMNAKVADLRLTGSVFTNPSGLDDGNQHVTAYDMAAIMRKAVQNESCRQLLSCKSYTIPATNVCGPRELVAGHAMVSGDYPYEGEICGKGGKTKLAGRTLVTYVDQEDFQLIVVVLGDDETRAFLYPVMQLYKFTK